MSKEIVVNDWFLGDGPSLADCALIPRIALACHYGLGGLENYPGVNAWFENFKHSDTFKASAPVGF